MISFVLSRNGDVAAVDGVDGAPAVWQRHLQPQPRLPQAGLQVIQNIFAVAYENSLYVLYISTRETESANIETTKNLRCFIAIVEHTQ